MPEQKDSQDFWFNQEPTGISKSRINRRDKNTKNYQDFKFQVHAMFKSLALTQAYGMSMRKQLTLKRQFFPKTYMLIAELDVYWEYIQLLYDTSI